MRERWFTFELGPFSGPRLFQMLFLTVREYSTQALPGSNCSRIALILTLPWYLVAKLQMPLQQKLSVCGIFLLGGFVVAAGIVRCTTLKVGFAMSLDHSCKPRLFVTSLHYS